MVIGISTASIASGLNHFEIYGAGIRREEYTKL
jgi:hypothetical protein